MMKVGIYTLTRDRLEYTKHCFKTLREKAGYPFDHLVVDNGSQDGTPDWLDEQAHLGLLRPLYYPENRGISMASNLALDILGQYGYDLIIKMDNDCEVRTPNLLREIVDFFLEINARKPLTGAYIVSPRVEGIVNQPSRVREEWWTKYSIGVTGIIGGLFHVVPGSIYRGYRYPQTLPLAWGQDDHFCHYMASRGATLGYIEQLTVAHYETTAGQAARYPEYFERKRKEEKVRV